MPRSPVRPRPSGLYWTCFGNRKNASPYGSGWSKMQRLRFKRLSPNEVDAYLAPAEWRGKAGGYAIQGLAGALSSNWSAPIPRRRPPASRSGRAPRRLVPRCPSSLEREPRSMKADANKPSDHNKSNRPCPIAWIHGRAADHLRHFGIGRRNERRGERDARGGALRRKAGILAFNPTPLRSVQAHRSDALGDRDELVTERPTLFFRSRSKKSWKRCWIARGTIRAVRSRSRVSLNGLSSWLRF